MKKYRALAALILAALLIGFGQHASSSEGEAPIVIVLSWDGMRHD